MALLYTKRGIGKTMVRWIGIDDDRVWASHGWRGGVSYYDKKTKHGIDILEKLVCPIRML